MTVENSCISSSKKQLQLPGGVVPFSDIQTGGRAAFAARMAAFEILDQSPALMYPTQFQSSQDDCNARPNTCASFYVLQPVQHQSQNFTSLNWTDQAGFLSLRRTPIRHVFFQIGGFQFDSPISPKDDCRIYGWNNEQLAICARETYNDLNETVVAISMTFKLDTYMLTSSVPCLWRRHEFATAGLQS
jgi:hypothetical protein